MSGNAGKSTRGTASSSSVAKPTGGAFSGIPESTECVIGQAIADRRRHVALLKTLKNPHKKFESRSVVDEERRRIRIAVRRHRAGKKKRLANLRPGKTLTGAAKPSNAKKPHAASQTQGSRHLPCYTCGLRQAKCNCFSKGRGLEITRGFKRKLFQSIPQRVKKSRIQTWHDTGDMSAYKQQIGWNDTMRYWWLFATAFTWRHFSNSHVWTALEKNKAVLQNQLPDFAAMEKVLRAFKAGNVSYHGGLFYSGSSMKRYRWCNTDKWIKCKANQDFITREILALKIVWRVAQDMRQDYDNLQKNPTRQYWKICTENFLSEIGKRTRGICSDYSMKITLEGVLLSQPCLEKVVSWWPMMCPAYKDQLPLLYPHCRKKQSDLFLAASHFHRCLKATCPKYYFRDSLAQLCWMERSVT